MKLIAAQLVFQWAVIHRCLLVVFWAALNISTANELPHLFYIEDNGYGISVPQEVQTPGGDQVANLSAYKNLKIVDGDGTCPIEAPKLIKEAIDYTRAGLGTCLLRLKVPRLCGHTFQDTQTYKPDEMIADEQKNDPLPKLKDYLEGYQVVTAEQWKALEEKAYKAVKDAVEKAKQRPEPSVDKLKRYVYAEKDAYNNPEVQLRGGLHADDYQFPQTSEQPNPQGARLNMLTAIRIRSIMSLPPILKYWYLVKMLALKVVFMPLLWV